MSEFSSTHTARNALLGDTDDKKGFVRMNNCDVSGQTHFNVKKTFLDSNTGFPVRVVEPGISMSMLSILSHAS